MNMKKIFAAMAATAISATSFAAMSLSANAADQIGQATLMGSFGTESCWDFAGTNSSVAVIDGDAQYECVWTVSQPTSTGSNGFFVTVVIEPVNADNFTTATFPDLAVTLDEVWVDGTQLTGYDASNAVNTNYYETATGVTRIYLRSDWADQGLTKILTDDMAIESEIKVLFTVEGTGQEGTSNVTPDEPATDAPEEGDTPAATTTAAANNNDNKGTTTTTAKKANGGKTESSTKTGDAGVGIAVAAIAVAGAAAFVARKKD